MTGCSAAKCSNNSGQKRMFRFPSSPTRRKKWQEYCRRDKWSPNENSRLCEVHFDDSQFENKRVDGKRLLRWYAVPTVYNLPDNSRQAGPRSKGAANAGSRTRRKKICKSDEEVDGELEQSIMTEHSYVTTPAYELNIEIYKQSDGEGGYKPQDLLMRSLQELREQNTNYQVEEMPAVNIEEFLSIEHDMPIEIKDLVDTVRPLGSVEDEGLELASLPKNSPIKFQQLPLGKRRKKSLHANKVARLSKEIDELKQELQHKEELLCDLKRTTSKTAVPDINNANFEVDEGMEP